MVAGYGYINKGLYIQNLLESSQFENDIYKIERNKGIEYQWVFTNKLYKYAWRY